MARDPKAEAALALHRFGFGPRIGSIAAMASDPHGAVLAELDRPGIGRIGDPDLLSGGEAARAAFHFRQDKRAQRLAERAEREMEKQASAPPQPGASTAPSDDAGLGKGVTPSLIMPREWQHHNGEDYDDLFDRMRAGFAFDEVQEPAIDVQLAWFEHNPDYLERVFQRAQRYMYHIITEVEARGMPLEFALLPVVESAYEPFAYSTSRAAGLWQFIPDTGARFGLKRNWWFDGRRDVVESTRAALDYLQALHDQFDGDWLLAIAAYNVGENSVQRELDFNRANGKPADFWHLRLPAETRAYVPKLLALKRLMAEPERYGLEFAVIPNEPYFAVIDTDSQIDLKIAAQLAGTPLGIHLHPTQLYESFSMLIVFFFLLWLHKHRRFSGQVILFYALLYSIIRFAIEFLRDDPRGDILGLTTATGLSTSQIISLIVGTAALILLIIRWRKDSVVTKVDDAVASTTARA